MLHLCIGPMTPLRPLQITRDYMLVNVMQLATSATRKKETGEGLVDWNHHIATSVYERACLSTSPLPPPNKRRGLSLHGVVRALPSRWRDAEGTRIPYGTRWTPWGTLLVVLPCRCLVAGASLSLATRPGKRTVGVTSGCSWMS